MVSVREIPLITRRDVVVEGDRPEVEAIVRTILYVQPRAHRNYAMLDLASGVWRVGLEIPS